MLAPRWKFSCNQNLTMGYAAGTLGDSSQVSFTLVSLTFQSINPTGPAGTQLGFAPLISPRQTKTIEAGGTNLGNLRPLTLVIQ